ncbi:hypothetical protein [Membranihabitans marinus]|uniref:hypothetical protein n=1 Tax=Membranihabitans marinus TaxID=1227546 RepID=UPI001F2D888A|nr:hypothetical protein [Membranihabitans marinus]
MTVRSCSLEQPNAVNRHLAKMTEQNARLNKVAQRATRWTKCPSDEGATTTVSWMGGERP